MFDTFSSNERNLYLNNQEKYRIIFSRIKVPPILIVQHQIKSLVILWRHLVRPRAPFVDPIRVLLQKLAFLRNRTKLILKNGRGNISQYYRPAR